jgi:hypothetical protein
MLILLCELGLRQQFFLKYVASTPVEIHNPGTLIARIDAWERTIIRDQCKILMLGDSVMLGKVLASRGVNWRENNFSGLIRGSQKLKNVDINLLNLGINGALPGDLYEIARLTREIAPHLTLFNIGVRSFSADFQTVDAALSRPWLAHVERGTAGFTQQNMTESLAVEISNTISTKLLNISFLLRYREYLQALLFGSTPIKFFHELFAKVKSFFASSEAIDENVLLLLKAKKRFSSISFAEGNVQRRYLGQLLEFSNAIPNQMIGFYSQEKPGDIEELISADLYREMRVRLSQFVSTYGNMQYLDHMERLEEEFFLDHVHVDERGYRRLFPYLETAILRGLNLASKTNIQDPCNLGL